MQFLPESTLVSLLGTIGGLIAGTLVGLPSTTQGVPFALRFVTFVEDMGILLGILFGLYPSVRAALMAPHVAIQE
ncbi:MAG: hypothetical protein ACYCVB_11910 [Bacilli bacterium]